MMINWDENLLNPRPKKITESDLRYNLIICMLFLIFKRYEDILHISTGESPFTNYMSCKLLEADNFNFIQCIRISFPNVNDVDVIGTEADFTEHELVAEKDIINEYLAMSVNDGFIPSYRYGEYPHQKVCSVYLDYVWKCFERTDFYFYYIDSPYAYKQVEQLKNNKKEIPKI